MDDHADEQVAIPTLPPRGRRTTAGGTFHSFFSLLLLLLLLYAVKLTLFAVAAVTFASTPALARPSSVSEIGASSTHRYVFLFCFTAPMLDL